MQNFIKNELIVLKLSWDKYTNIQTPIGCPRLRIHFAQSIIRFRYKQLYLKKHTAWLQQFIAPEKQPVQKATRCCHCTAACCTLWSCLLQPSPGRWWLRGRLWQLICRDGPRAGLEGRRNGRRVRLEMRLEAGFNTREWKIIAGIELLFHLAQAKNKFAKLTANLQWWSGT